MNIFKKKVEKKKDKISEDKELLKSYDVPVDYTNKDNIKKSIKYVKSLWFYIRFLYRKPQLLSMNCDCPWQ